MLLRLTSSPRCLSSTHLEAVILAKLLHPESLKNGLVGIYLVTEEPRGHYRENQGLSLLVYCSHDKDMSHGLFPFSLSD